MEDPIRVKARKGTKSCTECECMLDPTFFPSSADNIAGRRRKVRCIRLFVDSQVCRACEERHSTCIPQEYSTQRVRPARVPSRHRISKLESRLANLSKVVRTLETKLGYVPTDNPETVPEQTSESEDSESDDGSVSDVVNAEPSHIRSLFQNDWLSVDMQPQHKPSQERKARLTANLTAIARHALQMLIPSKEEVSNMAGTAFEWLPILDSLLPQPLVVKSKQDILDRYEHMHEPEIDAVSLASWLVAIAITSLQVPQECRDPSPPNRTYYQRWLEFARAVNETVERTILCHDRLLGTIGGLGIALHCFRMQVASPPCYIGMKRHS